MGADQFPLRLDLVGADVALVGGDTDLLIDTGESAQLLDVAVHRLVGVVRQGLVVLEGGVLVFIQNIPGNLVQFDGDAVRRLDGRDIDVVALDIAAAGAMLLATAGFSACLNNSQKSSLLAWRPHPQLRRHICHHRNRGAMLPESFSRPSLSGSGLFCFN